MFDPDWPETMLQLSPGTGEAQVIEALRAKLARLDAHPDGASPDAQDLAAALRSVAAQMIGGPGAAWDITLAQRVGEAGEPRAEALVVLPTPAPGVEPVIDAQAMWPERVAPDELLTQARAIIASTPNLSVAIARVRMLASAEGLGEADAQRVIRHVAGIDTQAEPARPLVLASGVTRLEANTGPVGVGDSPGESPAGPGDAPAPPGETAWAWWVGGAVVSLAAVVLSAVLVAGVASRRAGVSAAGAGASGEALPSDPASGPSGGGGLVPPAGGASGAGVTGPGTPRAGSAGNSPASATSSPRVTLASAGARASMPNPQLLLKDLRDASRAIGAATGADKTPAGSTPQPPDGAIARFASVVGVYCDWWPRLDDATRRAGVETIVEAAFKCATDAEAEVFVGAITPKTLSAAIEVDGAAPPTHESIWPESGRAGLLARLLRERELPPPVLRRVEAAVQAVLGSTRPGATFDAGAEAALRLMPLKLLRAQTPLGPVERQSVARDATSAAERWTLAARAATASRPGGTAARAADTMALDAVESILISGPELSDHPAAFNFVQGLLAKLGYRENDPARARAVAWLADARISIGDASSFMQMLASIGPSSGVDATMTFPLGATPLDRDNARSALAAAWAVGGQAAGGVGPDAAANWLTAARAALNASSTATIDTEHFTAAASLARICRAAAHRHRGEPVAPDLLEVDAPARAVNPLSVPSDPKPLVRAMEGDGAWAIRYLVESKTAAARVARLDELLGNSEIGPVDAGVVAEAALGAGAELRIAAQAAALRYAARPTMLNAVLDALPRAPRSARNVQFLAQMAAVGVVSHTSPSYMLHYRRGLVERVLFETAGQSPALAIDEAASLIAEANLGSIGRSLPVTPSPRPGLLAAQSAEAMADALRAEVTQLLPGAALLMTPVEIDQRRRGRLLVGAGLVHRFLAHQAATADYLAVLAVRERPGRVDEIGSLMTSLTQARSAARSAAEQARQTQEVIVRLWAVRLGEQL